ncbi:peptide MFS transporter [uncultured Pseudonocardia sp.]|uniref:peptide MFS transporter n=3 Tax=Pseudonocardia TaxID=1847 RepID=UPI00261AA738|nr:peptide MFS transporter [uncultured Pseudonocardia sp.]
MTTDQTPADVASGAPPGHPARPRGFGVLFLVDLWERFGFYGTQAILVLFASASVADGGLGLATPTAATLFGAYLGTTFMLSLAGGWVGDRLLGTRNALLCGAVLIGAGYVGLALGGWTFVATGLVLVSAGTALLKPNLTSLLGLLYRDDEIGREAGISLFYVGIQLSALAAPLVAGLLGEVVGWSAAFSVSAAAMVLAVVTLVLGSGRLGEVGARPIRPASPSERRAALQLTLVVTAVVTGAVIVAVATGIASPRAAITAVGLSTLVVPMVCYLRLLRGPDLTRATRTRMRTFLWVLFGSALFWMLIGQGGGLLNLFAAQSTLRTIGGLTVPASWLQSATPLFILVLAPLFAARWRRYGSRFGTASKFAAGLLLAGASFLVMAVAAHLAADGTLVSPLWLLTVYLLHACGELIVSAVGISAAVAVAPPSYAGQMIGVWWLFSALGVGLSSQLVNLVPVIGAPSYFLALGVAVAAYGVLLLIRRRSLAASLS